MAEQQTEQLKKNREVLNEIERNVPAHLRDNLMKKVLNTEQEDTAKTTLARTDITPELRAMLEKDLADGKFRFYEEIEDPYIVKKLDAYYDREVKAAISEGRLPPPDEDPFYQKMALKWDAEQLKNLIVYEWPPDSTEEDKKRTDVATAYRGKIYCPNGVVRPDVIEHEKVHLKQQGDTYDTWIAKYRSDKDFMIDQEVEAYRVQLQFIEKTLGHAMMLTATVSFAKFLSSDVYGNIITTDEALAKIQI